MPALQRAHEGDEPHFHEWSEDERKALAETIWKAENVVLTTVGIDVGSSTSHLMFARVHLQRKTQLLSSEFVVVRREILWRSPILLTPFLADFSIDAERLRAFIDAAYAAAGLAPDNIDSGAVILTGEALKRRNAQAIAGIFASEAGKFVCASAGHHMESVLAAHGAGAVAMSRHTHRTVLNVDIGGGTTKLALIENGQIRATCAVAVGGRLLVQDAAGNPVRVDDPAHKISRYLDIALQPEPLAEAMAEIVLSIIEGRPSEVAKRLHLTPVWEANIRPHLVTFSGGVAEYIFGRETETFGDIAKPLAERIARAFSAGRMGVPMMDPGQGIRATVIGASQFSVQLSGKTIHLSDKARLPVHNVPVVFPVLDSDFHAQRVAAAITNCLSQIDFGMDSETQNPVAIGIRWQGEPHYQRLRSLAAGIAMAAGAGSAPLILIVDRDVGRLLGHILEHELGVQRGVVSIDGIELREFDYVDIGPPIEPADVVPVVIKSLLFPVH
jgi:ethanolamine utilization protein EutA